MPVFIRKEGIVVVLALLGSGGSLAIIHIQSTMDCHANAY